MPKAKAKAAPKTKAKAAPKTKAKAAPKTKAKAKAKPAVERDVQNGITRPKAGTSSARVWEVADMVSKKVKKPAKRKDVLDIVVDQEGLNSATASTQFGRWRQYNGLGAYAE